MSAPHEWERDMGFEFKEDLAASVDWEPMVTWFCPRCESRVTGGAGTLVEILGKDTDCDEKMVELVMGS